MPTALKMRLKQTARKGKQEMIKAEFGLSIALKITKSAKEILIATQIGCFFVVHNSKEHCKKFCGFLDPWRKYLMINYQQPAETQYTFFTSK
jgi:hypothetical protein